MVRTEKGKKQTINSTNALTNGKTLVNLCSVLSGHIYKEMRSVMQL